MNPDDLEQRIARVPWAPPPREWREDILASAKQALPAETARGREARNPPTPDHGGFVAWWRLWRRPAPWTVLAGALAMVAGLNWASARLADVEGTEGVGLAFAESGSLLSVARAHEARLREWSTDEEREL